jgi:hypothetical protein
MTLSPDFCAPELFVESNANNCAIFAFYIVNLRADLTSVFSLTSSKRRGVPLLLRTNSSSRLRQH